MGRPKKEKIEVVEPEVVEEAKKTPKIVNHMKEYGLGFAAYSTIKDNPKALEEAKKAFEGKK